MNRMKIVSACVFSLSTVMLFGQGKLPSNYIRKLKAQYKSMSFEARKELGLTEKQFVSAETLDKRNYDKYLNQKLHKKSSSDLCSNGDFEEGLVESDWEFYWGGGGEPVVSGVTAISQGSFTSNCDGHDLQAHHAIVGGAYQDPYAPLSLPSPNTGTNSFRLGNACPGKGREAIRKSNVLITSNNAILKFKYAVVLNDPANHSSSEVPYFGVQIRGNDGVDYSNLVNLGNGANFILSSHPMLEDTGNSFRNSAVKFKDWSCLSIDLSSLIGKYVDIIFENKDCSLGAHFGYSYIDDICMEACTSSGEGAIALSVKENNFCGISGKICVDYHAPDQNAGGASNIEVSINLIQDGNLLHTLNSPQLSSSGTYCFEINLGVIHKLDKNKDGFDIQVIGTPSVGSFGLSPQFIGTLGEGVRGGLDYAFFCYDDCVDCCPGKNLIANGDFTDHDNSFESEYAYYNPNLKSNVNPGTYSVMSSSQAHNESPDWRIMDMNCCGGKGGIDISQECCNLYDKFLVVNGMNNQPSGSHSVIYETVLNSGPVVIPVRSVSINGTASDALKNKKIRGALGGRGKGRGVAIDRIRKRAKDYKFCIQMKHLSQSTFDIAPEGEIILKDANGAQTTIPYSLSQSNSPCFWDQYEATVNGVAPFKISISLREDRSGDGNDLAIDKINLVQMSKVAKDATRFDISSSFVSGSNYNVAATPVRNNGPGCDVNWTACELDQEGNCNPSNAMTNIYPWNNGNSNWFYGFGGVQQSSKGKFEVGKKYRISYSVKCDCKSPSESSFEFSYDPQSKIIIFIDPDTGKPVIVKNSKIKMQGSMKPFKKKN